MVRYSQNFLVNEKIADFIVESAQIKEDDIVLEIGPGRGILTKRLVNRAKVIAIEIDENLCAYLSSIFSSQIQEARLQIICEDALKVEFPKFTKLVANIPYHISSPLLFKILSYDFNEAIVLLQEEFAERLCASSGSKKYGRLSVMMYYNGSAKILKKVRRGNFSPAPKVDSAIVHIKKEPRFCYDPEVLSNVVRKIFQHRRKKIKNILGEVPFGERRAEELTPEEICEVAKHVHRLSD